MKKHICRNCGLIYEYCRGCLLSPISYKENGFCSKACQTTHQDKIEEVVPTEDVEVVVIKEDTSTPTESAIEYPYFFTATEEDVIEEKEENNTDENKQNYGETVLGE